MIKSTEHRKSNKSVSRSTSKGKVQLNRLKDLQRPLELAPSDGKHKNRTKSSSKCKSSHRLSKESFKELQANRLRPLDRALPKQNLFIQNRRRAAASQDKAEKSRGKKDRFFRRKKEQVDNRKSSSRKESKRSTDNENQQTMIQRLKAENEYYKQAFMTSKESLEKLQRYLHEERLKRNNEKQWFKYQINNLKRQLTTQKVQLGHIFTFDSFHHQDVSNMIIQTENQGSSLVQPPEQHANEAELQQGGFSELSIDSK